MWGNRWKNTHGVVLTRFQTSGATLKQQVDALQTQYTAIGDQLEGEQDNITKVWSVASHLQVLVPCFLIMLRRGF